MLNSSSRAPIKLLPGASLVLIVGLILFAQLPLSWVGLLALLVVLVIKKLKRTVRLTLLDWFFSIILLICGISTYTCSALFPLGNPAYSHYTAGFTFAGLLFYMLGSLQYPFGRMIVFESGLIKSFSDYFLLRVALPCLLGLGAVRTLHMSTLNTPAIWPILAFVTAVSAFFYVLKSLYSRKVEITLSYHSFNTVSFLLFLFYMLSQLDDARVHLRLYLLGILLLSSLSFFGWYCFQVFYLAAQKRGVAFSDYCWWEVWQTPIYHLFATNFTVGAISLTLQGVSFLYLGYFFLFTRHLFSESVDSLILGIFIFQSLGFLNLISNNIKMLLVNPAAE